MLIYHPFEVLESSLLPGLLALLKDCQENYPEFPVFWQDTTATHFRPGPPEVGEWDFLRRNDVIRAWNAVARAELAGSVAGFIPAFDATLGIGIGGIDAQHAEPVVYQAIFNVFLNQLAAWQPPSKKKEAQALASGLVDQLIVK